MEVGEPGTTALTVYVRFVGLVKLVLFVGVRVIEPATVGVMVKVWAVLEFEKVNMVEESPALPVPVGARVMVPVYGPFGATVKLEDVLPALPLPGPAKV